MPINKRRKKQWEKADISYQNYMNFIINKGERYPLSILDLFYIRNFKGGNASFHMEENVVADRLIEYSKILSEINNKFKNNSLSNINKKKIKDLICFSKLMFNLISSSLTKIDGFNGSFCSVLLHCHFPKLYPIADKWLFKNVLGIDIQSSKDIINNYGDLVKRFYKIAKRRTNNRSVREIDKYYFIRDREQ